MDLSPNRDRLGDKRRNTAASMDTSGSQSYVSLSLVEIQERFQELMQEEQPGLTLEEPDCGVDPRDTCNPYDRAR